MVERVFAALTQDTVEDLYEPTAVADLTVGQTEDGDNSVDTPAPKGKARGRQRTAGAAGQSDPQAKKKLEAGAAAKLQAILNTCQGGQGEGGADEGDPDDDDGANELDDTA